VNAPRRLVKHLARVDHPFRLASHLKAQLALEDVPEDEAGVLVSRVDHSGRRDHLGCRHLPAGHRQVRQIVLKNMLCSRLGGGAAGGAE